MENYKIRVANKGDIKEAQELFFDLGYKWTCGKKQNPAINECPTIIRSHDSGCMTWSISSEPLYGDHKEITLPELRDMVVLKRNDVGDATHTDGYYSFYVGKDKNYFFSSCDKAWRGTWKNVDILKPIEKPMKEYLRKNSNGTYSYIGTVQPENVSDFMIEIPKTAELVLRNKQGKIEFFKDKCGSKFENGNWISVSIPFARLQEGRILFLKGGCQAYWDSDFSKTLAAPFNLIESRHTHPEELPFIDDECYTNKSDGVFSLPKSEPCDISNWVEIREEGSLNDQYAEIETVCQSAWQKQEGGSHYKNLKIQPMQYALENKLDYAQANVVKYVTRHKEKNGKEDLLKAIHNLELMIEFYYGGGE